MTVRVSCSCGRALNLADNLRGMRVRCPECSAVLSVPAAEPADVVQPPKSPPPRHSEPPRRDKPLVDDRRPAPAGKDRSAKVPEAPPKKKPVERRPRQRQSAPRPSEYDDGNDWLNDVASDPWSEPAYGAGPMPGRSNRGSASGSRSRSSRGSGSSGAPTVARALMILALVCCVPIGLGVGYRVLRAVSGRVGGGAAGSEAKPPAETTVGGVLLKPVTVLNGTVSLLIPDGFQVMDEQTLMAKYPAANRPSLAYTSETGAVNIALNHTPTPLRASQLRSLHGQMDTAIRQQFPDAKWYFSGFTHINGREWMQLDFQSTAVDTNVRNIMVATAADGRMLLVSFNVTQELESQWLEPGRAAIQSISIRD